MQKSLNFPAGKEMDPIELPEHPLFSQRISSPGYKPVKFVQPGVQAVHIQGPPTCDTCPETHIIVESPLPGPGAAD